MSYTYPEREPKEQRTTGGQGTARRKGVWDEGGGGGEGSLFNGSLDRTKFEGARAQNLSRTNLLHRANGGPLPAVTTLIFHFLSGSAGRGGVRTTKREHITLLAVVPCKGLQGLSVSSEIHVCDKAAVLEFGCTGRTTAAENVARQSCFIAIE